MFSEPMPRRMLSVCLAALLASAGTAPAQPPSRTAAAAAPNEAHPIARVRGRPERVAPTQEVALEAGTGRVVRIPGRTANLFAADPKVVEVRAASQNSIFIFGVSAGRSTVAALDDAGNPLAQFDVAVHPSSFAANEAAATVRRTVPGADVQFAPTANGLAMTGHFDTAAAGEQAAAIGRSFLADKQVLDDRTVSALPQQVTLRVRVAEISRNITRQFGINWTSLANFGRWGLTAGITDGLAQTSNPPNTLGTSFADGRSSVNTVLDLLAQDQLITMLAEPNLTARSGETASFLAGGEFPIPIAGSNNQITVAFKSFGVSLSFVPTVLSPGRISLHVRPEVSELTTAGAVSVPVATSLLGTQLITIPAISVRRAETTVELGPGQSFAIAGLLSANTRMNARGLPYLGELPVIGPLFKSDLFLRDQTELVIVVTPYLVNPVGDPNQLQTPTDDFVPAADVDRVGLGRQRARSPQPTLVLAPSAAALAGSPGLVPNALPPGAGFILH